MFVPVNVSMPLPTLVMPSVPTPFSISPLKVVEVFKLPTVNIAVLLPELVIDPSPEIAPTDTE